MLSTFFLSDCLSSTKQIKMAMALSTSLAFMCIFVSVFANEPTGGWNTKDFQRREHSLVKPYQGKTIFCHVILGPSFCDVGQ